MVAPDGFRAPIVDLVEALVHGDFDVLDQDGRSGSVGAEGLRRSITEYRRTLVTLPDEAFDLVEAGRVTARPGEWWIVVPMWTAEEGRSDLSLELAALPTQDGHRLEVTGLPRPLARQGSFRNTGPADCPHA